MIYETYQRFRLQAVDSLIDSNGTPVKGKIDSFFDSVRKMKEFPENKSVYWMADFESSEKMQVKSNQIKSIDDFKFNFLVLVIERISK